MFLEAHHLDTEIVCSALPKNARINGSFSAVTGMSLFDGAVKHGG